MMIDRDEILALLEEQPYATVQLAELLDVPERDVVPALRALQDAGVIKRIGVDRKWALASHDAPPAPPPANSQSPWRGAAADIIPPAKRQATPAPKASKDGGTSWWVGLSRDELNARAREHQPRMHASKFARIQPGFVE